MQVQISRQTIEVYYNYERIALHQRSSKVGGFSTIAEHMPANIRFIKNWSMDHFTLRARKIGPHTYDYCCKIFEIKKHPEQAYKVCMGIFNLAKKFSDQRMEKACKRAAFYEAYAYKALEGILQKGMDELELQGEAITDKSTIITESHPNIRGGEYFK